MGEARVVGDFRGGGESKDGGGVSHEHVGRRVGVAEKCLRRQAFYL